jgi:hypothetical protein
MPTDLRIDLPALQEYLMRRQPPAGRALVPWLVRRIVAVFAALYLLVYAMPALLTGQPGLAFDLAGRAVWLKLALPFAVAVGATLWAVRAQHRQAGLGVKESAQQIEREWRRLTQGRWVLRMLLWGVGMAVFLGLTVGLLVAVPSREGDLLAGSRVLTALAFFCLTLAWTIPVMFAIRWYRLRWVRRFIVAA